MLKNLLFLKLFKEEAFISKQNNTRGGEIERVEKELIVLPKFVPSTFIPTTVIPVENLLNTFYFVSKKMHIDKYLGLKNCVTSYNKLLIQFHPSKKNKEELV